jgi:predicted Ser/Thr protein kinase
MRHGIRRWWQKLSGSIRPSRRAAGVAEELRRDLNLPGIPLLTRRGGDGTDNIYLVSCAGKTIGVLRLADPSRKGRAPPAGRPYAAMETEKRIAYEWTMYAKGAESGLTPKPLWRAPDALLCEYLPGQKLHAALEKDPAAAWDILCRAARAVELLHKAGITHMDVSLHNMQADGEGHIYFIDFEYAPAPHVPPPAQRVYDHLRLIESTWKFIPDSKKADFGVWLDYFSGCLDDEMRQVKLKTLEPSLKRVLAAPALGDKLRQLFQTAHD